MRNRSGVLKEGKVEAIKNQLRYMQIDRAELRTGKTGEGGMVVEGVAIVYDTETVLWEGSSEEDREIIEAGAAGKSIASDDIRSLWNHDNGIVLGRTTSGTLELSDAKDGVHFRLFMPDSDEGRSKYESIKRGDVTQMSFRFDALKYTLDVLKDEERGRTVYTQRVSEMRVYEVSPVTFPAYETTEVYARSRDEVSLSAAAREASRAAERAAARDEVMADVLFLAKQ